jgi:hypothetical protein
MTRWLAPLLVVAAGCGSSTSTTVIPDEPGFIPAPCAASPSDCTTSEIVLCRGDSGYDRIRAGAVVDPLSTGVLSAPEPGTICLRGNMAAFGADEYLWNQLYLTVDERTNQGKCVRAPLDAQALGVRSFEFELDQVPTEQMFVTAGIISQAECAEPGECAAAFTLLTRDRQDLVLLRPGTNRASLADFVSDEGDAPFDTRRLAWFGLNLEATETPLDYAYCVSGLRFLDATGRQVALP